MKKFKHINTGEIITYQDGVIKAGNCCIETGVEPSSDFWEESIWTTEDGMEAFYNDNLAWVINNNFAYMLTLGRIHVTGCLLDKNTYKVFSTQEAAEEYIRTFKNYKTVDGKQIEEGDVFYCYDNKRFKCIETKFGQFKASKWDGKRYRTKEEVEELILFNKPCLSLNDLLEVWGWNTEVYKTSPLFLKFKELVNEKIKL